MGCPAFLLTVLTRTAQTAYFGHLYDVPKPTEHHFETADRTLGASRR
ncbi:hypothetical protein TUE45_pSRTUE45c_0262 (plasmid) [Streptomyces reticuli]|nr:hypothetical protein TUE45_pSRTUE45c_0262 [Streptomyces reticuli]